MDTRLSEMTGEMRGPLLVGASTTIAEFMLPRVLGEFNALYPQVRARLIVANSESIEGRVAEHTLDVGLIEAPAKLSGLRSQVAARTSWWSSARRIIPLAELEAKLRPAIWPTTNSFRASRVLGRGKLPTPTFRQHKH
jgi:DNA-binding transcriptional LysR family regulator